MKRCNRFGAFFPATLFLQAALALGSLSISFSHAGVVNSQTDTEAIAIGERGRYEMMADWSDTVKLTVDPQACRVERDYDGEAIPDETSATESNPDAAAAAPATNDSSSEDYGSYSRYKCGHLDSFYGDRKVAADEAGANTDGNNTVDKLKTDDNGDDAVADDKPADEANKADNSPAATENTPTNDENVADNDNTGADNAGPNNAGTDNKVAEDENTDDSNLNLSGDKTADGENSANEDKKAGEDKTADAVASEGDECDRCKYEHIYGRHDAANNQDASDDGDETTGDNQLAADQDALAKKALAIDETKPAAEETPADNGYFAEKTDEAYGREYQPDTDDGVNKASDDSKDDAGDDDDDSTDDEANASDESSSVGCLVFCDALVSVFSDATSQISTEIHCSYVAVCQLSALGSAK